MTDVTLATAADADALSRFAEAAFVQTFGHIYDPADLASFLADWNPPEELRAQIAGSLPARLMNNAFLLSRLGVGLLAPARIRWMAPLQTYLGQLETLGAFATPDRKENSIERTLSV